MAEITHPTIKGMQPLIGLRIVVTFSTQKLTALVLLRWLVPRDLGNVARPSNDSSCQSGLAPREKQIPRCSDIRIK